MNRIFYAGLMLCLGFVSMFAQTTPIFESTLFHNNRVEYRNDPVTANPDWAPFFHGVASGDPLSDRVIIWTRVTPEDMNTEPIEVTWKVATDPQLADIVQEGSFTTDANRDYTVKVDVTGLAASTTYYYGFEAMEKASLTGRTKTTPTGAEADHLRFGVVSCSNFQAGYFNGYAGLAARNDLDAVIHLGDYIYEYADGVYGDADLFADRPLEPSTEIVTEEEYRTRYSTYRLDTALARAHQQHPFIAVWDDHESANDAYTDGAENHDPATQGDWETRKSVAKKVYFEWMPIREQANDIVYRTIQYGDLLDLIM
ncbi:MAG: alkaline phosphatase D family protein, partial [Bacteroidota bacterium]